MPTDFSFTQSFPSGPDSIFNLLKREDFILAKCEATGSLSTTASVESVDDSVTVISNIRKLPADLPAPAKSLVGDTITVTEIQKWSEAKPDGSRQATVNVDFSGPMKFEGVLQLEPTNAGAGSTITTTGKFTASVPFIGGKIEKVAAEQTGRYLAAEERIVHQWL